MTQQHLPADLVAYDVNGVTLLFNTRTLALCRLVCESHAWLDNGLAGAPIWQLHVVDAMGRKVDLDGASAASVSHGMEGETLHLQWLQVCAADSGAGPFDVRVTIAPATEGTRLTAWRISVENNTSAWTIWHLLFPHLCGVTERNDGQSECVFWPEMWGVQTQGWDNMTEISGPCGGYGIHSMQFMGFTQGEMTLYLGAHDPCHWQKQMTFKPEPSPASPRKARMHFLAYPPGMTQAGNCYQQTYDIIVGEVAGDWFDASRVYAGFAREQTWVNAPPRHADQGPREEREVLVWEQASVNAYPSDRIISVNDKPASEWVAEMAALRQKLGVRMAVHLYQWHQTPFDTNYPDYFPEKAGLKELVAELRSAGVVVMPYINGRLWDQAAPSYDAEADRNAAKSSAQRVNPRILYSWPESYGNGQLLSGMCLHSPYWHYTIVELCRRITEELGCGGIYLDQLGCFGGGICLAPDHGHPLGGGDYWLEGYRRLLAAVREAIGPEPLLTTENNWEGCVADFDALLDTQWNKENNIPIFPTVFWGRGAIYGGDVFANSYADGGATFVQRMGMRFVWGGEFGWGHFEPLLKPEQQSLLEYFTSLCRLRNEYGRQFCRGEFLRPPMVTVVDSSEICINPLRGPVLASMWSDPDTPDATIFLVNVTRETQHVRVRITDARWQQARVAVADGIMVSAEGTELEVCLVPLGALAMPVAVQ